MPIYAYRCERCDHELDALQKISDAPLTDCPACGEPALKKQITAAAFRLKGGGWYETDFKQNGKRNLAEGGNGSAAKSADSGDKAAKSDSGDKAAKSDSSTSDKSTKEAPKSPPPKADSASKPQASA